MSIFGNSESQQAAKQESANLDNLCCRHIHTRLDFSLSVYIVISSS